MRSFSLVLLRRLLFRSSNDQRLPLYDQLSADSLSAIEKLLLHSLLHERSLVVKRRAVDTAADLANNSMSRGRPWHALQQQVFSMAQSEDSATRESAYGVFSGSPNLIMDLQPESVVAVLQKGLQDPQSVEVCLWFTIPPASDRLATLQHCSFLTHECCSRRRRFSFFGGQGIMISYPAPDSSWSDCKRRIWLGPSSGPVTEPSNLVSLYTSAHELSLWHISHRSQH